MTPDETKVDAPDDADLLRTWRRHRNEEAFAEMVRRHMKMVYGVALRRTEQAAVAEEVTCAVFSMLARKAAGLEPGPLGPWLHRAAIFESARALRSERRHRQKLQAYALHCEAGQADEAGAVTMLPRLDGAVNALPDRFRQVVVLRFYEGLSFRDIAGRLGESEAAVQRRGHRALARLAEVLRRAGLAGAPAALAGVSRAALCEAVPGVSPSALAARALSTAAAPSAGILSVMKTLHPVTLMASTAALTAVLLSIPLTLQARRANEAERRLAEVTTATHPLATAPAGVAHKAPAPVIAPADSAAPPVAGKTEAERREEAHKYAATAVSEEEAKVLARLKDRLRITPEQETTLMEWHKEKGETRQAWLEKRRLRENYDPSFFEIEYGFHPDVPPHLLSVLSPEQQETYRQWEQQRRTNYVEGWSGAELSYLADPVELTAEQKDQIFTRLTGIWQDYSAQDFTALRTADDIEARKDADHQARRALFLPILTPEQLPKWEKLSLDFNRDLVRRFQPVPVAVE